MRAVQDVWRQVLRWRFKLFQRHRYHQLVLEELAGKPFLVLPDVFNPALFRTSAFLIKQFEHGHIPRDAVVLDMGTGSGVGAVFAAQYASHITAVDINPEAVRCAQINVLLNRVEDRVCVRQGDLFEPVQDERFDVILFNPPFFRGEPDTLHDHAWRSESVVERFAAALPSHLTSGGYALVVLSTDGDTNAFMQVFRACGLEIQTVAQTNLINEMLTVYQLKTS